LQEENELGLLLTSVFGWQLTSCRTLGLILIKICSVTYYIQSVDLRFPPYSLTFRVLSYFMTT